MLNLNDFKLFKFAIGPKSTLLEIGIIFLSSICPPFTPILSTVVVVSSPSKKLELILRSSSDVIFEIFSIPSFGIIVRRNLIFFTFFKYSSPCKVSN